MSDEVPTPRTDAEVLWIPNGPRGCVSADFARQLEREQAITRSIVRMLLNDAPLRDVEDALSKLGEMQRAYEEGT